MSGDRVKVKGQVPREEAGNREECPSHGDLRQVQIPKRSVLCGYRVSRLRQGKVASKR